MRLHGEEHCGDRSPEDLSTALIDRREALRSFRNHRRELRNEVEEYEKKYEISSAELHDALRDGRLVENSEICSWAISYQLLKDMDVD